jgi:hypothetical protein
MPIVNPQHRKYTPGDLYIYKNDLRVITKLVDGRPHFRSLITLGTVPFTIDFMRQAVYIPYYCAYSKKHRAKTRAKIEQFRLTYPEFFI